MTEPETPISSPSETNRPTDGAPSDERLLLIQRLREAREKKGSSVEDLSDRTRISLQVLTELESGNFEIVEPPSLRAFLRMYAKDVGVPVEEVRSVFPEPKTPVENPPEGETDRTIPIVPRRRVPWGTLLKVALVAAFLGGLWWWPRQKPSPRRQTQRATETVDTSRAVAPPTDSLGAASHQDSVASATAAESMAEQDQEPVLRRLVPPSATVVPPAARRPSSSSSPWSAERMTIRATDTVWVQLARADGSILYDAIMTRGFRRQWTVSDTIRVNIGRWWAAQVMLDDRKIDVPHGSQDPGSFLCTPLGISRP